MKRWGYLILLLIPALGLGGRTDVARLKPVEVVRVGLRDGAVFIQTDTGDWGCGEGLAEAVADMHEKADAEIFLDTAEYALVAPQCENVMEELGRYLRPSCVICFEVGEAKLEEMGQYLKIHRPNLTLARYLAGVGRPSRLVTEHGRTELEA